MKLTIVSVNYHSEVYCNTNITIFNKINKGTNLEYDWYIVDNNLKELPCEKLDPKFKILTGHKERVEAIRLPNEALIECGSIHHGLGINIGLKQLDILEINKSDLFLVTDPDFILSETIESVYNIMMENNYNFYGAAYMPGKKRMIRNFPAAFCQFINPKIINPLKLDYRAAFDNQPYHKYYPDCGHRIMHQYKTNKHDYCAMSSDQDPREDYVRYPNLGYHMHMKIHTNQATLHSTTQKVGKEEGREVIHKKLFRKIYKEIKHGENK